MPRPPLHVRIRYWFANRIQRAGDLWNRLVAPVEHAIGRIGDGVFGAFDSFENLEASTLRVLGVVFWPVAAVARRVSGWLPESSGGRGVFSWPGRVFDRLVRAAVWAAEKLNLDGVLFLLVWLLTPLWWPVLTALGFINAWLQTRRFRELALGAPALLLAAPFAYVALAGASQSQGDIADRYKVAVRDALASGDGNRAQLYERKLAQLGVDTRRNDYRYAASLSEDGDLAGAYLRMRELAPLDGAGYLAAHGWIATNLLTGRITADLEPRLADGAEQKFLLAQEHIDRVQELGGSGPRLAQLQAVVHAEQGRQREAAETIRPFAEVSINAAGMRLRWLGESGQAAAAREQARALLDLCRRAEKEGTLSVEESKAWVFAAEMLGAEADLEAAVLAWLRVDTGIQRPQEMLGVIRRQQFRKLLSVKTSNPDRVIDRLFEAARLGSPPPWLTQQATLVAKRRNASRAGAVMWRRLLETPAELTDLREAVATVAAAEGEIALAREKFRELVETGIDSPPVWNNYAWVLASEPSPEPAEALAAVDRALATAPGDHRFRETRGQVLIQLGRWEQAVADLEYALNRMPESPEIHRALATAYDALAKPRLASSHRRLAGD